MIVTYRLQLQSGVRLRRGALPPYVRRLGISHLYLSPITEARRGRSTHGYDVTDHNRIREVPISCMFLPSSPAAGAAAPPSAPPGARAARCC